MVIEDVVRSEEGICIVVAATPEDTMSRGYTCSVTTIDKASFVANPQSKPHKQTDSKSNANVANRERVGTISQSDRSKRL
jgi:hypothetical protein